MCNGEHTISGVAVAGVVGRQHHTVTRGRSARSCPVCRWRTVGELHCLGPVPPQATAKLHTEGLV
jgi:hypothetical protein